jgi:hypothetical protein
MEQILDENRAVLTGAVLTEPEFSHKTYGESFYIITLGVTRKSGYEDCIPLMISEKLLCGYEMNEGDMIVIPSPSDITLFFVKPIILEQNDKENNIPKAKQKQEKRKPNSAVIGDKRFTIDTKKRVIIY